MANPINPLPVGVGSVLGYALGGFFLAFGAVWLLAPVWRGQPHTATDAYVGAATMLLGALLMAPASLSRAVEVLKPLIPWGRRATDITPPDEDKK